MESTQCIKQATLSLFFSDLVIKIAGYCAMSGSKFRKNQKSKNGVFDVPDVLSSITPCGISFPFLFFITNPDSSSSSEDVCASCWLSVVTLC